MKDLIKIIFMISLVIIVYIFRTDISNFILNSIIYRGNNKVLTYNEYYLGNDYLFVQNTDITSATNYQDVLNIFYTVINSGDDNYTFMCKYSECISDVNKLIDDSDIISNINNFVHPFNSYYQIKITIIYDREVNIKIDKLYTDAEIEYIQNYVDNYIKENIGDSMNDYDKIKKFHDHVINNTEYDVKEHSRSFNAYELITTNKAICSGYSDIMAIYLDTLGIKNYRISSENHIWNLVNLDGKWYHLDATWDDPVASDGKQYLIHNFFMISTEELFKLDDLEHNYNKEIYKEA